MKPARALVTVAVAASLAAAIGCAKQARRTPLPTTRVDTASAGTTAQARKFLEGRWSLMSFEVFPPGREAVSVTGAGTLTYDDFGNLAMEIRVDPATSDRLQKAGIPIAQGVLSSTGRAVLDVPNKKLTYVLEGQPPAAAASGPLAMNRPRHWEVEGDVLTLTTKDDAGNPLSVGKWKRAP
jgi:hypothetical protein